MVLVGRRFTIRVIVDGPGSHSKAPAGDVRSMIGVKSTVTVTLVTHYYAQGNKVGITTGAGPGVGFAHTMSNTVIFSCH